MLSEVIVSHEDALVAFEKTLGKEPNRFRARAGAMAAAAAAGDNAAARRHAERLLALCKKSDSERPELNRARALVSGRS